ncbi:MAG: 30S ribosomal protein S9 [Candidatus Woesearchaeota archaeon]|nr:MAG: 30S ribosomal protein S9 [Candidatus Woesearchaeota archaeon]
MTDKKKTSKKVIHVSGKRKKAIARATLREGKGSIRVNGQLLDSFSNEIMKMKIMEPLILAGELSKKVNIDINVRGGGWQGQTEASRLSIAKALVEYSKDPALKKMFLDYDRHMLINDVRRVEPSKPNDSKARAARQKSYR